MIGAGGDDEDDGDDDADCDVDLMTTLLVFARQCWAYASSCQSDLGCERSTCARLGSALPFHYDAAGFRKAVLGICFELPVRYGMRKEYMCMARLCLADPLTSSSLPVKVLHTHGSALPCRSTAKPFIALQRRAGWKSPWSRPTPERSIARTGHFVGTPALRIILCMCTYMHICE